MTLNRVTFDSENLVVDWIGFNIQHSRFKDWLIENNLTPLLLSDRTENKKLYFVIPKTNTKFLLEPINTLTYTGTASK
jgi:hypothetical protein